jgi:hypothetical protein
MKNTCLIFAFLFIQMNALSLKKINASKQLTNLFLANCKLIEEQENGITIIKYEYDTLNRLTEKKYLKLNYIEKYSYDNDGFLIEINNTSENAFITKYTYQNGKLVTKIQQYKRISSPNITHYEYNNLNELIKTIESYLSTETVTQYANGKATSISNPNIKYDLNSLGLVIKASCLNGPKTINVYKYNKNDVLLLKETYSEPNKITMYTEYEISIFQKANLGDEFVETYKGFPKYTHAFGENNYYKSRTTNFTTNNKNGLLQKVFEDRTILSVNADGNLTMLSSELDNSIPQRAFIYSGCSN